MRVVLFVVLIETACAFGGCLALFATGSADDAVSAAGNGARLTDNGP